MALPLLITSIIPDLLSFPPLLRLLALLFGIFLIIFSILDFNVLLLPPDQRHSLLKWTNDAHAGIALWRRILMMLSGVAAFSGAVCVVLVARGKYSNYVWGIINCVTYGVFAMAYGYAGSAQLNIVFFLPMQFVGIYMWRRNLDTQLVARSRSLGLLTWCFAMVVTLLIAVAFYYEIPQFAKALTGTYYFAAMPTPWRLDAATNALNICAQILMLYRFWEQWLFWISVDVLQIVMYSGGVGVPLDINVLLMFILFQCNAFYGCYSWFRRAKSEEAAAADRVRGDPENPAATAERGLVIGKFWPPHKGHTFILDYALERCKVLYIIVCERHDRVERPSGLQRRDWLAARYPTAKVMLKEDKYDQEDSRLWADLCRKWLGFVPDVVFTSEKYGDPFCAYLGSRHILVDLERKTVPISATRVRADPLSTWEYQTSLARSIYALRVVIVGAESTGKTTLAQRLAKHYNTCWVPEVGRDVTEAKLASGSYKWASQDFMDIATAQAAREDELAGQCNGLLICDTDAFATGIWHERYMNYERSATVEAITASTPAALYLIPDVAAMPFVQDGTRDGEHLRKWMFERFLERLQETERPFIMLVGDYEGIFQQAVKEVDRLLDARGIKLPQGQLPSEK
jgi:HTH-type transcriptional repressor of NAD biosynthesis genes